MARRTTDLLDVFRAERRTPDGGGAKPSAKAPREKRGFEGLLLLPRQLLLGGSVLVLLLVFAFVLGLSVGRRGGDENEAAALSAQAQRAAQNDRRLLFVLGRVPLVDPVRQTANEPARLYSDLVTAKGVAGERIWIQDDSSHQHLQVVLGPFADKAQAVEFLTRANLFTARLGGVQAFQAPEYRWWRPDELPRARLPAR